MAYSGHGNRFDELLDRLTDCDRSSRAAVVALLEELESLVRRYLYDPAGADSTDPAFLECRAAFAATVPRPALAWLLAVVSNPPHGGLFETAAVAEDTDDDDDDIPDRVSAVIAHLCGRAATGAVVREWPLPRRGVELSVKEPGLAEGDIGFKTWGAARALARLLDDDEIQVSGRVVLELGSGTGLAGLAAAACGASRTYLTDFSPACLNSCRVNTAANVHLFPAGEDAVEVMGLDWRLVPGVAIGSPSFGNEYADFSRTPTSADSTSQPQSGSFDPLCEMAVSTARASSLYYDVIIGADLLYEATHPRLISRVVARLLPRDPEAAFHIAVPLREMYEAEVAEINAAMDDQGFVLKRRRFVNGREEDTEMVYRVDEWVWR